MCASEEPPSPFVRNRQKPTPPDNGRLLRTAPNQYATAAGVRRAYPTTENLQSSRSFYRRAKGTRARTEPEVRRRKEIWILEKIRKNDSCGFSIENLEEAKQKSVTFYSEQASTSFSRLVIAARE